MQTCVFYQENGGKVKTHKSNGRSKSIQIYAFYNLQTNQNHKNI